MFTKRGDKDLAVRCWVLTVQLHLQINHSSNKHKTLNARDEKLCK